MASYPVKAFLVLWVVEARVLNPASSSPLRKMVLCWKCLPFLPWCYSTHPRAKLAQIKGH